jgi:hypothetical protein
MASSNRPRQIRLAEPLPFLELLFVGGAFTLPLFAALASESIAWTSLVVVAGGLVATLVILSRHRAWIVMMPREERLRVVRLRGFSYSAATLHLSDAMSVECALAVDHTMWLFVVAKDGRTARVIPATSSTMIDHVQSAIDEAISSSETRPGTPSPR